MILGCLIVRGNPADTDQYQPLLEQHRQKYGRMPRQVTADGGFASKDNLAFAKGHGVSPSSIWPRAVGSTKNSGTSVQVLRRVYPY
jgi:IS5 family transposase